MTDLLNKLVSKATSHAPIHSSLQNYTPTNLLFKPDHHDSHITTVHLADSPDSAPLFRIRLQTFHKPNIILFRNNAEIGTGIFPNFRTTTELVYQGQPVPMKVSNMTGYQSFEAPGRGRMEWQPAMLVGSTIELKDVAGNKLARYKKTGMSGTKKLLELDVQVDEYTLGLLVLTIMATAAQVPKSSGGGGVGDAVSAIAGV